MRIKHAVIVTGDRKWTDTSLIGKKMGSFPSGTLFIHGNAAGADTGCDENASTMGYPRIRVPYFAFAGKSGGPQRNQYMLEILLALKQAGAEVRVLAFHDNLPESRGTVDMIRRAQKAGVKVTLVRHREL